MGAGILFLDRDGVVNRERGAHTWRVEDLEVLPGVAQAVNAAHAAGLRVVVVTNQSGIGLGLYNKGDVERLHDHLRALLAADGAYLDAMYYCPHHPSEGRCLCRKPGSLLLERALSRFAADPGASWMIGDRPRDVEAAHAVGVCGVLVEANGDLMQTLRQQGIA